MGDSGQRTPYGFTWGPMDVTRIAWLGDRGRVLSIKTPHAEVQVRVSDGGQRITTYPVKNAKERKRS